MPDLKKLMQITEKQSQKSAKIYEKKILDEYKIAWKQIKEQIISFKGKDFSRIQLLQMLDKIENILQNAGVKGISYTNGSLRNTITFNYNAVQENLQKALSEPLSLSVISEQTVNSLVVNNRFSKISWHTQSVQNINYATNSLRTEIVQGTIQGKNYAETANKIYKIVSDKVNMSASDALRIVKTETRRASQESRLLSFKDSQKSAEALGFKSVKIWNGGSSAFERNHGELNGTAIGIDELFVTPLGNETEAPCQTGDPSDDINCNCFITFDILET